MADPPQDVQVTNARVIEEFRANGGVLGPPFSGGPMMLLTTTGRRTGRRHTTPLMYVSLGHDGGDPADPGDRFAGGLMVIASNAGGAVHPDWYLNLEAAAATVELGTETFEATAETVRGDERVPLWDALVAGYPFFRGHQARTEREIPLVVLRRAARR
jgi:deazaflavin-dependent oxidoreductase (nitroreductase family)